MKTMRTFALLSVLGTLASVSAWAQPAPGDQPPPQRPPQDRSSWGRPDPETRRKALLSKYDTNKDGKLDDSERAAIGKDVEDGKFDPRLLGGRPGGPGFGPGPRGLRGAGGPDFGPRHQELLDKYDANKDGKLDAAEHEAIRKDIESGKLQPPPFGPRRGGFGPPPPPDGSDGPPPDEPPQE